VKTCEQYLNAIGDLVDGTLGPLRRAELVLHLETCDRCRALVTDLQRIAEGARALDTLPPPDRVWTSVAARLQAEGRLRPAARWGFGRHHTALALAAALVLAIGASLVFLIPADEGSGEPEPATAAAPAGVFEDPVQGVASELALTERHFQNAIEQATRPDVLVSPETAAVLQKNLLVVNQAIAESRAALEANPDSTPARQSLYDALRQKIQFLQDTIALMNVMRQGDAIGAAELVEGGKS
jgi:anti-sigma factor RsiW